jgi:hypothetical protein
MLTHDKSSPGLWPGELKNGFPHCYISHLNSIHYQKLQDVSVIHDNSMMAGKILKMQKI